ncbi:MAG: PilZ domain-containing protein [Phycisphaeraceae bacterium]
MQQAFNHAKRLADFLAEQETAQKNALEQARQAFAAEMQAQRKEQQAWLDSERQEGEARRRQIEEQAEEFDRTRRTIGDREAKLDERQKQVETELEARQKDLDARKQELDQRQVQVDEWTLQHSASQSALKQQQAQLVSEREDIEARRRQLDKQEKILNRTRQAVLEVQRMLSETERSMLQRGKWQRAVRSFISVLAFLFLLLMITYTVGGEFAPTLFQDLRAYLGDKVLLGAAATVMALLVGTLFVLAKIRRSPETQPGHAGNLTDHDSSPPSREQKSSPPSESPPFEKPEGRSTGRIWGDTLECSLGTVIDLSASGMRVHRRAGRIIKPDTTITVTLQSAVGALQLKSRVVWAQKIGFWRQEIGLKFLDVSPELRTALSNLGAAAG